MALMKPDLSIFPITGWEVETVSTDELVLVLGLALEPHVIIEGGHGPNQRT